MKVAVVLFTRDLRVHDNPALSAAARAAERVVPLFVHDPALPAGDNRRRFLLECLTDLKASLRQRGADLVELRGDPATEAVRVAKAVGAEGIGVAADVSGYARDRERRLERACADERIALKTFPGVTVVPPGAVRPGSGGGEHYKVFTPYWRAWQAQRWRDVEGAPRKLRLPDDLPASWFKDRPAPTGGESAARRRLTAWLPQLEGYEDNHDAMAADKTSRLSPYLHFGCLSPREVAARVDGHPGAEPFVRQLCWRDFYHQVLFAFPDLRRKAYRASAEEHWRDESDALQAWREGHTGVPIVDAGMRQLLAEGWMHNRARLITASYLTKHLNVDWRAGGDHFFDLLLDGDVANNYGNWQWVAGTGNDTKPYRRFNPIRQAHRFDPVGDYVRRYVPELADVEGKAVHEPWNLPEPPPGYPAPLKL
ncbi:cryptochrome/photolyase family protein [Dactylosporangium siamense]|uniref:Deoxyribodipyrimidine photo-lyase n=1 Tax=Dactylosporangium siamense TaxID=685454 RepID=A0A919PMK7_9ACTN|nr:deoxyribodipyrimidine photo-lyase [Dactylosporangium siamense]GIG46579.1 deoxyribodipyrimidine photo-lyase [Dactylosporangium siamense]